MSPGVEQKPCTLPHTRHLGLKCLISLAIIRCAVAVLFSMDYGMKDLHEAA